MRNPTGVVKIFNIMILLLVLVISLIIWSVRLLQGAYRLRDSSMAIASALVAVSAGGVIIVYGLMDGCLGQFSQMGLSATNSDFEFIISTDLDGTLTSAYNSPNL